MLVKKLIQFLFDHRQFLFFPLIAVAWNGIVYYGGRTIAAGWTHYDMTLPIDRITPFLPWTILIYWGCFLFWILCYLWMALQKKELLGRFFLMHFLGELICFLFFLLLPTTNLRPEVPGNDIWSVIVRLQYEVDAADNLFPSIHCMISWMCWIGLRSQKRCPAWCRWGALAVAVAVCISTLTLKQHVIADVIGAILIAEFTYRLAGIPALLNPYIRLMERLLKQPLKEINIQKIIK